MGGQAETPIVSSIVYGVNYFFCFFVSKVRALGKDLGLPEDFCQRHPFPGPGLAIRVICAKEPYMGKDFAETQVLIKVICSFANAKKTVRIDGNCVCLC